MKKFFMALLCVALVLSCTIVAFADPSGYSITVNQAKSGEDYSAYKIFDVTYDDGNPPTAFTYTISDNSPWWTALTTPSDPNATVSATSPFTVDGFTFTETALTAADGGTIYVVTYEDDDMLTADEQATAREADARAVADKLYAVSPKPTAAATETASGNSVTLDVGEPGYYFVTTSLGALCALNTAAPTQNVNEKNSVPTIEKKVSKSDQGPWADETNVTIGDRVYFQITVTDGDNTNNELTVTDTMSAGLELYLEQGENDIQVHVNNALVPATVTDGGETVTNYTLTPHDSAPYGFEIVFSADYIASLPADTDIVITYSGILNSNAKIVGNGEITSDDPEAPATDARNTNTVTMEYSNQTDTDTVYVDTYYFELIKTDDSNAVLTGAEFDLYRASTGGTALKLTFVETDSDGFNVYRIDPDASPSASIEAGKARVLGVGAGDFWLEETVAPDGYNQLDAREQFTQPVGNYVARLGDNGSTWDSGAVHVVNETGGLLPSTGGIGTYLFYGVGAILVVGAVVVLISKKRMHAYSE